MSSRALGSALLLGAIVAFIAFNLNNACDISFGFVVLEGVPVYLTALSSIVVGMLVLLPHTFSRWRAAPRSGKSRPSAPGRSSMSADAGDAPSK